MEETVRTSSGFTFAELVQDRFNKISTLSEIYILNSSEQRKLLNK